MNLGIDLSDTDGRIEFRQFDPRGPKRLVEECFQVIIGAVQRCFGKQALLRAIRECQPIDIPVSCNPPFRVYLTYDTHPLIHKPGEWSALENGTARIWFVCSECRRRKAKLFYYMLPASTVVSELKCGRCHHLTYLSVNCSKNRFYENVVRPYRRLQRIKEYLQASSMPLARRKSLERQEEALEAYLRETVRKFGRKSGHAKPHRFSAGGKRVYKNLELASSVLSTARDLRALVAESSGRKPNSEAASPAPRVLPAGSRTTMKVSPPNGGSASSGEAPVQRCKTNQRSSVQKNPTEKSQEKPEPRKTIEQQLDEHDQFWLDAISEFRTEGLITDDHMRQFPELRRALEMVSEE